jgi:hypothetical protein
MKSEKKLLKNINASDKNKKKILKPVVKKPSKKAIFNKKIKDYKEFLKDDHDWDWAFIIRLLSFKLQRTRKCILENDIIKGSKKVAREIKEVEILLNRVTEDNYFHEITKDFHKKHGKLKTIYKKSEYGPGWFSSISKFTKETPQNSKRLHAQYARLWTKASKMQQDDLKRAFDLMNKNIWNWWD